MEDLVQQLPAVNAGLNAASALCLVLGYACARRQRRASHRTWMLSAVGLSTLFLVGYLTRHAVAGMTRFAGVGGIRSAYFVLLGSHTLLAALLVPLVLVTLWRAVRDRIPAHRRLARFTLPIWLYVSVTGVAIYRMLYH
jgi:putative membrane protein